MQKIPRLLIVSSFWPTTRNLISGIFVAQRAAALGRSGAQVSVMVPTAIGRKRGRRLQIEELGIDQSRVDVREVSVLRMPERLSRSPNAASLNSYLYGASLTFAIRRAAYEAPFDGCIIHGVRYAGTSLKWWRRHISGNVALVLDGADPLLAQNQRGLNRVRRLLQRSLRASDVVAPVGSPLKDYAADLGATAEQTCIIKNGTDLPPRSEVSDYQRPLTEARRITSVSNLVPLKGIEDNLKALSLVASDRPDLSWEYRIVGDGSERQRLEALAADLGIADRVSFLGRIPYDQTMAEIFEADIFSLPSWGDAFGIVYLEAMARMKPTIGCFGCGAEDIITDNRDGRLVAQRSPADLAEVLQRLILEPAYCARLGREGRETAESFTWDRTAEMTMGLLQIPCP